MQKLIVYLSAQASGEPTFVLVQNDDIANALTIIPLTEVSALNHQLLEVIVIVPGEHVLLTTLHLPNIGKAKLIQALPFALEEQLIADIETLHFAAEKLPEGHWAVAVVSKQQMAEWIATLQAFNIKPDRFVPEPFSVTHEASAWEIAIGEKIILRLDAMTGLVAEVPHLSLVLQMAMTSCARPPEKITLTNYRTESFLPVMAIPIPCQEVFRSKDQWVLDRAHDVLLSPTLNLLQGTYAVKRTRLPRAQKILKLVGSLLIAWIGLLFLLPLVSYSMLHARVVTINQQIEHIYKNNFPQATAIVAPKMRMQEKLRHFSAQAGEGQALMLLGQISQAKQQYPNMDIKRLDFQNNQMLLVLSAGTSDDLSAFSDALIKQGLTVKQQSATIEGSHINATLVIK